MAIQFYENLSPEVKAVFKLDTPNTSYVIGVVDTEQFLGHIYNLLLSHQPSVSAFSPDGGGGKGVVCLMPGPGMVWKD